MKYNNIHRIFGTGYQTYVFGMFLSVFVALPAFAGGTANTIVSPELSVGFEHDSNANLANGITLPIQSDNFLRVSPRITVNKPYKAHLFLFDASIDYRKGFLTNLSETNLGAGLSGAIQVAKGTRLVLKDRYNKSSFDQSLQGLTNAYKSDSNAYSAELKQRFARRLKGSIKYERKDKRFTGSSLPVAITGKEDILSAKLFIPITVSLISELSYSRDKQKYVNRAGQDFIATDYALGLRWVGKNRFSFWANAGYYVLNYALVTQVDTRVFKWKLGTDVNVSENLTASASYGKDGLSNQTYQGKLDYQSSENALNAQLQFSKTTIKNGFSPSTAAIFTSYSRWNAVISKKIKEKFDVSLRTGYLLFDAGAGRNRTSTAGIKTVYYIQDWLQAGVRYEYAKRIALLRLDEYRDNRFGIFVTMVF